MGLIAWMDGPLVLFGAAALVLAWAGRRRLGAIGATLASLAGLAAFVVVSADMGLRWWEEAQRIVITRSPEDYAASGLPMRLFPPLSVGSPAPDFTLPPLHGGPPVRLSDIRGRKPVVLVLSSFS